MKVHSITTPLIAGVLTTAAAGAELGYYRQPTLNGDHLVFASEGDLWTATLPSPRPGPDDPPATIVAHRLTASDGTESHPRLSSDGEHLAFAGEYDGNTDVYVMPADGGAPRRLTFHPRPDVPLDWTPDGATVLFRSARAQPLGRPELWGVSVRGGSPRRFPFGECTMLSASSSGQRFAYTPWSNERWHWKGYRGGTAPDIWVGDLDAQSFVRLTDDPANDMHPMWLAGRVFFVSDRSGAFNLVSDLPQGGDFRTHTAFAPDPDEPTAVEGYDIRWPSETTQRRGTEIVFCQGGALALYDVLDETVRRLDVRLASDRLAARRRFAAASGTASEIALSPDGSTLLLGSRGEIVKIDVATGAARQITRTPTAREWGMAHLGDDSLALITDAAGEQQIAVMPADGSEMPSLATQDREAWLFPPVTSPNGRWIAFADKTMRLHVIDTRTLERRQVDDAEAGEITDYRFSPDSNWVAYVKPLPNGASDVLVHSLRTRRSFPVSNGMSEDREPRWDPAGRYLYFISDRNFDPVMGAVDFEHIFLATSQIYVVPLAADTPPPLKAVARAAGFDLEAWAEAPEPDPDAEPEPEPDPFAAPPGGEEAEEDPIRVDTDGLVTRPVLLPIEPGRYRGLEAQWGSILYVSEPVRGLLDRDDDEDGPLGTGRGELHSFSLADAEDETIAENVGVYAQSADHAVIAYPTEDGIVVRALAEPAEEAETIDLDGIRIRVDARDEWNQMFQEAWRLQRDFYWAPNLLGVDWPLMRTKYAALLDRIGTREELNDVIGEMIGELGTSHTYIWGGQKHEHETADRVAVGMLGADIELDGALHRIRRIIPGQPWSDALRSPLAAAHLGVKEGSVLLAVDDEPLTAERNVYELLQDQANTVVKLELADDATGANRRSIEVKTIDDERELRYLAWVDANRARVNEASQGAVGYVHIPDMGGRGLALFARQFYPQFDRTGLVIDVRDNGGGFVSQMIIERLARRLIAFDQPRHGITQRYPRRASNAHMVAIIDQHAGSDGDVFPAAFRRLDLGPLVGTRTWGGVVGIRGDKPFVDMGLSTQPEFAWWDEAGWSIENRGVTPDVVVEITPVDRIHGRDPQLDAAVGVVLRRLQEDSRALPAPPAYPVRPPR